MAPRVPTVQRGLGFGRHGTQAAFMAKAMSLSLAEVTVRPAFDFPTKRGATLSCDRARLGGRVAFTLVRGGLPTQACACLRDHAARQGSTHSAHALRACKLQFRRGLPLSQSPYGLLVATVVLASSLACATTQATANTYQIVYDENASWADAQAAASAAGGYLVSITSAEEQAYVECLVVRSNPPQAGAFWIGLRE